MRKTIIQKNYASNVNSHGSPNTSLTINNLPETRNNHPQCNEKFSENAQVSQQKMKKTLLRELRVQKERTFSISC
jgi:hypothetical protein